MHISLALFNYFFAKCQELGFDTYEVLPDDKAPYPFVRVNQATLNGGSTKTGFDGEITINLDLFGTLDQKLELAEMQQKIEAVGLTGIWLSDTSLVAVVDDYQAVNLLDTSTTTPLNHTNLSFKFRY